VAYANTAAPALRFRPSGGAPLTAPGRIPGLVRKSLSALWLREDIRAIIELYSFDDFAAARRFLLRRPEACALLIEGYYELLRAFGDAIQPIIHVLHDPEENGDEELLALIRTGLPLDDAVSRLATFDDAWWRAASRQELSLNFDVE
jgi:hypothetical protein